MSIILDIILIAVLVLFVVLAAKKGFAKSLLELIAVVLALFLAYQLSPAVSNGIYDTAVKDNAIEYMEKQFEEIDSSSSVKQAEVTLEAIPDFILSLASSAGIDTAGISKSVATELSGKFNPQDAAEKLEEKAVRPIVTGVLNIMIFLLLAVVLIIVLKILAGFIAKIFNVPFVGTLNKILGAVLGTIKGVAVLVFICTVLEFVFAGGDSEFSSAVRESKIIEFINANINPFINMF